MATTPAVPDRLAVAAADWATAAAGFVATVPVGPEARPSPEAHVVAVIAVELLQPLAGAAARWTPDGPTSVLGRVEVKLRHLEATGPKMGRDLGLEGPIATTRALLDELGVRSTAPRREGGATSTWFTAAVDAEEARLARRALLALAAALGEGTRAGRRAGSPGYRFRDGPAVLAFWAMKVEACSPGVTQPLSLRFARRTPRRAIADAARELRARLVGEAPDAFPPGAHGDLIALCERTLLDLGPRAPG